MLDLVIGKRELGKTTFAVHLARTYNTRVIFDPRHMINTTSDILTDGQISDVLYSMLDTRSEIVVQPHENVELAFALMCKEIRSWLRDNPGKSFCLLVDEIRFIPNPENDQNFEFIVRCMPSRFVAVIFTSHGIVDVNTHLRRIADFWIFFQLTLEADLQTVRERCGETVEMEVKNLRPYQFIVWDDGKQKWRKEENRKKWYVPLERQAA